jgi:hypothetical protein
MGRRREGTRCADCGFNTCPRWRQLGKVEWFMVFDSVWDAAGMPSEILVFPAGSYVWRPGILCIGCLERRLGRRLTPADFEPVPLSEWYENMTPRLAARLGYR